MKRLILLIVVAMLVYWVWARERSVLMRPAGQRHPSLGASPTARADPVLTWSKFRMDAVCYKNGFCCLFSSWCRKRDSNPRPRHYE